MNVFPFFGVQILHLSNTHQRKTPTLQNPIKETAKKKQMNENVPLTSYPDILGKQTGVKRIRESTMRDWTRGTISTRSLKRTRSTLLPLGVGASEEWVVGRWVGDELMLMLMLLSLSPESHDFGSPKFGLSCKSIKRCASNILWFSLGFVCGSLFVYRSLKKKKKMWIFLKWEKKYE